jgi:hypothetical protein
MNGSFLIRGESTKLDTLEATDEWGTHIIRGGFHEEGLGVVRGTTGDQVMEQMNLWTRLIPK